MDVLGTIVDQFVSNSLRRRSLAELQSTSVDD